MSILWSDWWAWFAKMEGSIRKMFVVLAVVVLTASFAEAQRLPFYQPMDTATINSQPQDMRRMRRMRTSIYPVQIETSGRVVHIKSDHSQILPIYTDRGVLYMAMRLNKGTNWLNGLPRGKYFINNRLVDVK